MNKLSGWVLSALVLACSGFFTGLSVAAENKAPNVEPICPPGTAITAGNAYLSRVFTIGLSSIQSAAWDISGTPNLNIQVLQSNHIKGPFALWSNPSLSGSTVTNNVTATVARDGTPFFLSPSAYAQYRLYVPLGAGTQGVTATALNVEVP